MIKNMRAGFTLIEMMMVVLIIGILASIVTIKVNDMIRKAKDGSTYANLGSLRTALNIYYSNILTHPSELAALTVGRIYLKEIPEAEINPYHRPSSAASDAPGSTGIDDSGGWAYNNGDSDANFGKLWVNCTHTDVRRAYWTYY